MCFLSASRHCGLAGIWSSWLTDFSMGFTQQSGLTSPPPPFVPLQPAHSNEWRFVWGSSSQPVSLFMFVIQEKMSPQGSLGENQRFAGCEAEVRNPSFEEFLKGLRQSSFCFSGLFRVFFAFMWHNLNDLETDRGR